MWLRSALGGPIHPMAERIPMPGRRNPPHVRHAGKRQAAHMGVEQVA